MTDWRKLFDAICAEESGGGVMGRFDDTAYNWKEDATGRAQIRPCVLEDIQRHYGLTILPSELRDPYVAYLVFRLYIEMWSTEYRREMHVEPDDEVLARMWNGGGPKGWKKDSTVKYWKRIEKQLESGQSPVSQKV